MSCEADKCGRPCRRVPDACWPGAVSGVAGIAAYLTWACALEPMLLWRLCGGCMCLDLMRADPLV